MKGIKNIKAFDVHFLKALSLFTEYSYRYWVLKCLIGKR